MGINESKIVFNASHPITYLYNYVFKRALTSRPSKSSKLSVSEPVSVSADGYFRRGCWGGYPLLNCVVYRVELNPLHFEHYCLIL